MQRTIATLCTLALLAGCASANRGSSLLPGANGPTGVASTPAIAPVADGRHRRTGRLTVRIRIPKPRHHRRGARYISTATKGMTMAFKGPSKYTQVVSLTRSDPRCTGSPLTCTIAITLLAGNYTVTIDTYDQAPVKGGIPTDAHLLSTAKNAPFTMTGGITNAIGITLDGVPASLVVGGLPSGTIGTSLAATAFSVTAMDADGDIITGTYTKPVTLSDSDSSGATTIATSGGDDPPAGELLSSTDVATLAYTGGSVASADIGASASGATRGSATFAPAPVLSSVGTSTGLIGTSVSETLTGDFIAGATTVNVSGSGVTVSGVSATATTITASFFIDPEAATGARDVSVQTTAGSTSGTQSFTISNSGVVVVTLGTDSTLGTTPGACPGGASGDLRHAICNASAGDTIVFDTTAMCGGTLPCTITLGAPLPPVVQNQTIDGGYFGRVTVDGASAYRAFFVDTGTVELANLQLQNTTAHGGAGGSSGGGGGLGAGGGLFVNQASAVVTADSVYFLNCSAVGGNGNSGASGAAGGGGGGGGGLASAGGAWAVSFGGAGGGGVLGAGGRSGTNGGDGGTGGGGGGAGYSFGGTGGAGYATNAAGSAGGSSSGTTGASGGDGGFGGGGGGGETGTDAGNGGTGGFGGGGGGGGDSITPDALGGDGGAGGAGGGGGGGGTGVGTNGGGATGGGLATLHGGDGSNATNGGGATGGSGGGGAAAGPAVFVNAGSLTTTNSGASACTATAGTGGTNAAAGTADSTPVFNYAGTVNGSTTTGPVASALSSTQPSVRRARRPRIHRTHTPR